MKTINVSTLKAELSSILREASEGEDILVMDRKSPLARITAAGNGFTFAQIPKGKLTPKPPPKSSLKIDVVKLLLEDRRR